MGVPKHLISLIRNLYEASSMKVRIDNRESPAFTTSKGVRQGCILSPDLFNIYGEYVMRKVLKNWHGGISVARKKISNLRYADDTTLIAASEDEMLELIWRLEHESELFGLRINNSKTKIMIIDKQAHYSSPGP